MSGLPNGFVYLSEVDDSIKQDIRYAGNDNFMGRPANGYNSPVAILTKVAADALSAAQQEFRSLGYCIMVYDAYRPQRAVDDFWKWAADTADTLKKQEYYPSYDDKKLLFEDGFIARLSKHSRGSAVDLSIMNLSNAQPVDMGGPFDFFGPLSYIECDLISKQAQESRYILQNIMRKHGFNGYAKEWWHFEYINEPFPRKPEDHFDFVVE